MAMDWETAFFEQYQDACIGRLLRGIIHNLNGANQAFSLQATLFRTMFQQADKLLQDVDSACPGAHCGITALRDLLDRRMVMVGQMEEKVDTSQRIVARTLPLAQHYRAEQGCEVTLSSIVDLELEIMAADPIFKHRIEKTVELAPNLPLLHQRCVELHIILHVLLDNAANAMRETPNPALRLTARRGDDHLLIEVADNGPGVDPKQAERIFEPFVSSRQGALGVGLFLARKTVIDIGGVIECVSVPGNTCFTVTVPLVEVL